ncbi:hypothetical protein NFI96_001866, partial [Prochilodus magdalenae]
PKTPFADRWMPACQGAFETIIEKLTTSLVLGFANPKVPYVLHTDASTSGLGAALYQEQGDNGIAGFDNAVTSAFACTIRKCVFVCVCVLN